MPKKNQYVVLSILAVGLLVMSCSTENKETAKTAPAQKLESELPSLQARLDEKKAGFEKRASEDIKKAFREGDEAVAMSGVMETALNVGDTAPDFALPNAVGKNVTLSVVLQSGPVVLTWYRGGW